jgi:hypothetical protein
MNKYARICGISVVDVTEGSLEKKYHPSLVGQFIQVPENVEEGWTFENGSFLPPPAVEFVEVVEEISESD